MNSVNKPARLLGVAFLLQAITSLVSGAFLLDPLLVPDDIAASMTSFAGNAMQVRAAILGDMITAMGIVFLGAVLFGALRKWHKEAALVALGLYTLEAAILAVSRIATFSLLHISQEYVTAGQPEALLVMGSLALETMDFGYKLHMIPFCVGAPLFYGLLYVSRVVPRWLSLWGLLALLPLVVGSFLAIFGYSLPFVLYLPYVPFEFVTGLWILIKGISQEGT